MTLASFVEKIILPPVNCLHTFVKNWLSIFVGIFLSSILCLVDLCI